MAKSKAESASLNLPDLIKILPHLLDKKGIINVGGKSRSVYSFAKSYNSKIVSTKVPKKINDILEKLISDKNKTKCNSQRDTKEIHNGKELKI